MYESLVVYDQNSTYQQKIANGFKKIDDIKTAEWSDEDVQSFLQNQFGWKPKNLIVVDNETVFVGKHATEHLTNRQGVPSIVAELTKSRAEPFSSIASKLLDFTDESDEIHGEFPLDETAKSSVEDLLGGTHIDIN